MKATVSYLLFICLLAFATGCGASQRGVTGKKTERMIGLWEVKAIHNSNESGYTETPHGMFKMISSDGTFMNFMSTEKGAIITVMVPIGWRVIYTLKRLCIHSTKVRRENTIHCR